MATTKVREGWGLPGVLPVPVHLRQASTVETLTPIVGPDALTHSAQKPGGQGDSSGGNRDYVPGLARSGAALGIRNFFLEVHPNPDVAPSDGPNMLRLEDFEKVVADIVTYSYDKNERPLQ